MCETYTKCGSKLAPLDLGLALVVPLELHRYHLTFACGCRIVTRPSTHHRLTLVATGGSPACPDHHRSYLAQPH